ncbi:hypothetical protein [Raineya orbicola]|jgi:hypothetical protein|uniref:Uncharacterized protein n=1 Tax=Raineya orbicola TaxID=2016530 RepID=A0A2N3I4T9_9BACT|nr:hypothetical protein [Raineya orbicola]PKQ65318.1 hypothetical protein Rain11_2543 [Raineya orbicola]
MKNKFYILLGTFLLLFLWLIGTNANLLFLQKKNQATEKQEKPFKEQISAYEVKATFSGFSVTGLQTNYFLLFEVSFAVLETEICSFSRPIFRIAFFEKIFEHLIAPQAP